MKYLVFDLDETLLKNDCSLSEYTVNVIKRCKEAGYCIVINSARPFQSSYNASRLIEPDYFVMNGGAEIYRGTERIYAELLDVQTANRVIDSFKNREDVFEFSIQGEATYGSTPEFIRNYPNSKIFDPSVPFTEEVSKIIIGTKNPGFLYQIAKEFHLIVTNFVDSPWYRLNITTKESGQKKLFELLQDENPYVIAFGDDTGDLGMLKQATIGVALKNSVSAVLDEIHEVTEYTNDEDGCARYLDKYVLKREVG
ncbi:MAG: HAD family phosphatase [Erysipelotrichaceae bacterium]|nr:HAD family phosphatase [Erysipelotrichaceae bacterium]